MIAVAWHGDVPLSGVQHLGYGRVHGNRYRVGIFRGRQQRTAQPGEQGLHLQGVQHGGFDQQCRRGRRRQRRVILDQLLDRLAGKLIAIDLASVNVAGVNLAGVNLAGVKLGEVSLAGVNLAINPVWSDLAGVDLAGGDLAGVDLTAVCRFDRLGLRGLSNRR